MAKGSKGLGRGLFALLPEADKTQTTNNSDGAEVLEVDVEDVYPNPVQPRKTFDDDALTELADSIAEHGVISPLIVTPKDGDGRYMIIAGERRWRASLRVGLATVPVIVRDLEEKQISEVALIENLQREDLNPIETAEAMKRMMEIFGMTQENLAERLGKSRSTVANTLRLLQLTPEVIKMVSEGKLSAGHARALVSLPESEQLRTATFAVNNGLSVRELEKKVKDYFNPPEKLRKERREKLMRQSLELRDLINRMQRALCTKVSAIGNDNKGRIYIDYYTRDDLDRLSEIIELAEAEAEKRSHY